MDRIVMLKEDYVGTMLGITNCTDEELELILEKVLENDENGIGIPITEICEQMFDYCYFTEIGSTETNIPLEINSVECKCICSRYYLSFCSL